MTFWNAASTERHTYVNSHASPPSVLSPLDPPAGTPHVAPSSALDITFLLYVLINNLSVTSDAYVKTVCFCNLVLPTWPRQLQRSLANRGRKSQVLPPNFPSCGARGAPHRSPPRECESPSPGASGSSGRPRSACQAARPLESGCREPTCSTELLLPLCLRLLLLLLLLLLLVPALPNSPPRAQQSYSHFLSAEGKCPAASCGRPPGVRRGLCC